MTISGPEPDADGLSQMMDALSEAVRTGWDSPRVVIDVEDADSDTDPDDDSADGAILDYRIFGYPGGATILVVLDGPDLMQASVAVTGLAQHVTTWSPGLLGYSPDEVSVSKIDKPFDEENWLSPVQDDDESERPRWRLVELLDDELHDLAARYLIACAVRSLWNPTDPRDGNRAWEIVAGAAEHPWDRELSQALGVLLVQAARFENAHGSHADLVVHGSGTRELAVDMLRRARVTGPESETDGWADDDMRGHLLVERFMEDHQLLWNRVSNDEPPSKAEGRSTRQLRAVLWAGLRALATMATPLGHVSGPWQVLDQLDDDPLVSLLAEQEDEQNEEAAEDDAADVDAAAAAHALVWLAIRHPELLETQPSGSLVEVVTFDVSAFHQIVHATVVMAGYEPLKAALADRGVPDQLRPEIDEFAEAVKATDRDDTDASTDPYDAMHGALEAILDDGPDLEGRVRYLLAVAGHAARLTDSDVNPRRGVEGHVSSPRRLTHYLLADPAMHATATLHRHDEDAAIRWTMLALVAQVEPAAAGDLVAEFPELEGDDPRLLPASRSQAVRWIDNALQLARGRGRAISSEDGFEASADAQRLAATVMAGLDLPDDWPVHRLVSAAAEAAACILHSVHATDLAPDVFSQS